MTSAIGINSVPRFVSLPGSTDLVLFYWDILKQAAGADPALMSGSCSYFCVADGRTSRLQMRSTPSTPNISLCRRSSS